MKKTITTLILAMLCLMAAQAQNAEKAVKEIRAEYTKIKSLIAEMEKKKSSSVIYCMLIEDNVYDSRKEGELYYKTKTRYYYTDYNENSDLQLRMITENIEYGTQKTYRETFYIDDKTAFVYIKEDEPKTEKRLYYSGGKFIRYTENNIEKNIDDVSEDVVWMMRDADYQQQVFHIIKNRD